MYDRFAIFLILQSINRPYPPGSLPAVSGPIRRLNLFNIKNAPFLSISRTPIGNTSLLLHPTRIYAEMGAQPGRRQPGRTGTGARPLQTKSGRQPEIPCRSLLDYEHAGALQRRLRSGQPFLLQGRLGDGDPAGHVVPGAIENGFQHGPESGLGKVQSPRPRKDFERDAFQTGIPETRHPGNQGRLPD